MYYLFDSDALTALENSDLAMLNLMKSFDNSQLALSILTVYEYEFSISNMPRIDDQNDKRQFLSRILKSFKVMPLTLESAQIFGKLKKGFFEKTGINENALKRHTVDLALASVAIDQDFTLVSRDGIYKKHLQGFDPRLKVLDW